MKDPKAPGRIALIGSGETAATGGRVFESLALLLPRPLRIAVLETPAGFELNSEQVAGRVADFLRMRLSNYSPQVSVIAARGRDTAFSPDDPPITETLLRADLIFAGAGSPTYAVRQLRNSLAWNRIRARHATGAALVFASAGAIAVGRYALPVYEIYKAGHDLGWQDGLDLLGPFGLSLAFVPHWNNTEGGADLDTSRCFMGHDRFAALTALLPRNTTIVGIDEHTALIIDVAAGRAHATGPGHVTIIRGSRERRYGEGDGFDLEILGPFRFVDLAAGLPAAVIEEARTASEPAPGPPATPEDVLVLAHQRELARQRRDWAAADVLRDRIEALGWQVQDTVDGPKLIAAPGSSHDAYWANPLSSSNSWRSR